MNNKRLEYFHLRARVYALIRDFFASLQVLEAHTPVMSQAGNTEPNIDSFETVFTGHVDQGDAQRYLRTSPEYPLKRLLAEGLGDCYELGPVFRNGEAGGRHNPEFHMLEWYRLGFDHYQLAQETVTLVKQVLAISGQRPEVCYISYRELFMRDLGIDPFSAKLHKLIQPLTAFHIDPAGLSRDDWLDLLMTHLLLPAFSKNTMHVIYDWPSSQCALARIRQDKPPVAERFELYLGAYELANGYHELNDSHEQAQRFEAENARRQADGKPVLPLDEHLLATLDNLPDCAGVAVGIERLLMCLLGTDSIADVMAYPFALA